ncbi:MAG TPA: hypothetical protein VEQ61_09550, partial [Thermoleophilaceae bacterium]|nr:hypothetical protein [Thermoleophilaceae bacterium]
MPSLSSRRPSPALVIACLALFVSLGGVSYGVATGSIDGREIKDGAVSSADVRNNSLRGVDVRNGSLKGGDLARDSLGGAAIAESKLGRVPRAGSAEMAERAESAESAESAENSESAETAENAISAETAESADLARSAESADELAGLGPDDFARSEAEPVRRLGAAGQPGLGSGFSVPANCLGCTPAGFWRDPFGTVHLQGRVDGPGGVVFTLPDGYRPASYLVM